MESIYIEVQQEESGQRIDQYLALKNPQFSRTRIQYWLENGLIVLNDRHEQFHAKYKVKAFDRITIHVPEPEELKLVAESIPLDVIYEDDDVLVLNKAAGMVVHPAPGHSTETLVHALLAHCGDSLSGIGDVKRPGIIHRLDKDTSGLMVIAKNDHAHQSLSLQFHPENKQAKRVYMALVYNRPQHSYEELRGFIGRHPQNRQKMALVPASKGKEAITQLSVKKTWNVKDERSRVSLLECHLLTGRTHQIRVHCQSIQCPLIGDQTYGAKSSLIKKYPDFILAFGRQALHATVLRFIHPSTEEEMSFQVDLPSDMQRLVDALDGVIDL